MGERKRETIKERERERERKRGRKREGSERERERRGEYENREGKEKFPEKQMCQNCMPTIYVNSLCGV